MFFYIFGNAFVRDNIKLTSKRRLFCQKTVRSKYLLIDLKNTFLLKTAMFLHTINIEM